MNKYLALIAVAGLAGAASAQVWNENNGGGGDAGDLPATADMTSGAGALTSIVGMMGTNDADMYCINIVNPGTFFASMVAADGGVADFDTQLWLFRENGTGIVLNDDFSGTLSKIDSTLVANLTPGHYMLAITRYNRDPVDVAGGLLWNNSPFTGQRAPDGPGAANSIAGWTGSTSSSANAYTIALSGCEYCVPAPGAAALLGLGGLLVGRRRR